VVVEVVEQRVTSMANTLARRRAQEMLLGAASRHCSPSAAGEVVRRSCSALGKNIASCLGAGAGSGCGTIAGRSA